MKDFKNISDEIMKEVVVTPELKDRTLRKCRRNSYKTIIGVLVPAACVVLIIAAVNTMGWLPLKRNTAQISDSRISLMMEAEQGIESQPQDNSGDMQKTAPEGRQVVFRSLEEAKKAFGDKLLLPEFIPEGFKLSSITGSEPEGQKVDRVLFNYVSDMNSFMLTVEKTKVENEFPGYKAVDINGIPGYVRTEKVKTVDGKEQPYTEIHWFNGGNHYSVTGQINEELALNISNSMS